MGDQTVADTLSTSKKIVDLSERVAKLSAAMGGGGGGLAASLGVVGLVLDWKVADAKEKKLYDELHKIEKSLLEIKSVVDTIEVNDLLKDIDDKHNHIIGVLDDYEDEIDRFTSSITKDSIADKKTTLSFINWYLNGVETDNPPASADGHQLIENILFDHDQDRSLARLLKDKYGSNHQNYVATLSELWDKAQESRASNIAEKNPVSRLSKADYLESVYFSLIHLYNRARYLHDLALASFSTILHDQGYSEYRAASNHSTELETLAKSSRDKFYQDNRFDVKFEDNIQDEKNINGIGWSDFPDAIKKAYSDKFSSENSYSLRANIPNLGNQNYFSSGHGGYYTTDDVRYDPYLRLVANPLVAPKPNSFLTGLKMHREYTPDGGYFIRFSGHFSEYADGEFTSLGWHTQPLPNGPINGAGYVRVGGFEAEKLKAIKQQLGPGEQPVLTEIRFGTIPFGSSAILTLGSSYRKLVLSEDGKSGSVQAIDGVQTDLGTDVIGKNYLCLVDSDDGNQQAFDYLRAIDETLIGRQDADGNIDPSGIITDVKIERENEGSTLLFVAEVNDHKVDWAPFRPYYWSEEEKEAGVHDGQLIVATDTWALDKNAKRDDSSAYKLYYLLDRGYRRLLLDRVEDDDQRISTLDAALSDSIPLAAPVVPEGTFFKTESNVAVYKMVDGKARHVLDEADVACGWPGVIIVPDKLSDQIAKLDYDK